MSLEIHLPISFFGGLNDPYSDIVLYREVTTTKIHRHITQNPPQRNVIYLNTHYFTYSSWIDLKSVEGLPHSDDVSSVWHGPEVVGAEGPVETLD